MKSHRFAHEVVFALTVMTASILFSLVRFAIPIGVSWLLAAATAVAILRILSASEKTGGNFLLAVSSMVAVAAIGLAPLAYWSPLGIAAVTLWLVRSFRRYHSLALPIIDGVLSMTAFIVSLMCFHRTNSLAISLGVFFLLQGLHVYLPSTLRGADGEPPLPSTTKSFDEAYRRAEMILQGRQ